MFAAHLINHPLQYYICSATFILYLACLLFKCLYFLILLPSVYRDKDGGYMANVSWGELPTMTPRSL